MGFLYHHLLPLLSLFSFLVLTGISFAQAHVLVSYPIHSVQTGCVVIPDQIAPGLSWDFLKPSYKGNLDYGSPNGFLGSQIQGGYLAKGWTDKAEPDVTQYFEFSIQPREHCTVQLEGISMAILSTMITCGQKHQALSPQSWEVRLTLSDAPETEWTVFSGDTPVEEGVAYTIHVFDAAGNFSDVPLIPGGITATFRIYGFNATPLISSQEGLPHIHPEGGLIHANINNKMEGLDLTLHGTILCKKETFNMLKVIKIDHPLISSVKLEDSIPAPNPILPDVVSF